MGQNMDDLFVSAWKLGNSVVFLEMRGVRLSQSSWSPAWYLICTLLVRTQNDWRTVGACRPESPELLINSSNFSTSPDRPHSFLKEFYRGVNCCSCSVCKDWGGRRRGSLRSDWRLLLEGSREEISVSFSPWNTNAIKTNSTLKITQYQLKREGRRNLNHQKRSEIILQMSVWLIKNSENKNNASCVGGRERGWMRGLWVCDDLKRSVCRNRSLYPFKLTAIMQQHEIR